MLPRVPPPPANSKAPAPADLTMDATQCHKPQSGPTEPKRALPPSLSPQTPQQTPPAPQPPSRECGAHASVSPEARKSRGCAARRPRPPRDRRRPVLPGHALPSPAPPRPAPTHSPPRHHGGRGRCSNPVFPPLRGLAEQKECSAPSTPLIFNTDSAPPSQRRILLLFLGKQLPRLHAST